MLVVFKWLGVGSGQPEGPQVLVSKRVPQVTLRSS